MGEREAAGGAPPGRGLGQNTTHGHRAEMLAEARLTDGAGVAEMPRRMLAWDSVGVSVNRFNIIAPEIRALSAHWTENTEHGRLLFRYENDHSRT